MRSPTQAVPGSALGHRGARPGEGQQYVDMALLDVAGGHAGQHEHQLPGQRRGAQALGQRAPQHRPLPDLPEAADGWIIAAVGNDGQFRKFAGAGGRPELADDPALPLTNPQRVAHRDVAAGADRRRDGQTAHLAPSGSSTWKPPASPAARDSSALDDVFDDCPGRGRAACAWTCRTPAPAESSWWAARSRDERDAARKRAAPAAAGRAHRCRAPATCWATRRSETAALRAIGQCCKPALAA
ncbi:CoA transferase [Cupriavidus basilensis]